MISDCHWHFIEGADGYSIVLDAPMQIALNGRHYVIEAGYVSDGMSVPRFFWRALSPRFDPRTLKASVEHDWLYDKKPCSRKRADRYYRERLIQDGFPVVKAWAVWVGVRIGGRRHWKL